MAIERLILPEQGLALPKDPAERRQVIQEAIAFAEVTAGFEPLPEDTHNFTPPPEEAPHVKADHEVVVLDDGTGIYRQRPRIRGAYLLTLKPDGLLHPPPQLGAGRSEHLGIETDTSFLVIPANDAGGRRVIEIFRHIPGEPPSPEKTRPRNRKR